MNQNDLDALGMRIERIAGNMSDAACLVRALAEIVEGTAAYHLKDTDHSTLAYIVVKYINRIHSDITSLKNDFDNPASERYR